MGVRLTDSSNVALYDSVTGTAFGTVFASEGHALDFLDWLGQDPRDPKVGSCLDHYLAEWREQRVDPETGLLRERAVAA